MGCKLATLALSLLALACDATLEGRVQDDDLDAGVLWPDASLGGSDAGGDADSDTRIEPDEYLVLRTATMRAEGSSDAPQVKQVLRGSIVRRLPVEARDGWFKVRFRKRRGWMRRKRLARIPVDATAREVAIAHPDAFFKRQVRHPVWNPTGPLSSGNCAPTSLAIAAKVFGKEPPDLQVEPSIDRIRRLMNKPSDSGSASIEQVRTAASKLGLRWVATRKGTLDRQLKRGHMVVLTGTPGRPGAVTTYQRAFIRAGYVYTYDGPHSILVMALLGSGKYLVADPLSTIGTIKLGPAAMRDFFARWGGDGTAVWN